MPVNNSPANDNELHNRLYSLEVSMLEFKEEIAVIKERYLTLRDEIDYFNELKNIHLKRFMNGMV